MDILSDATSPGQRVPHSHHHHHHNHHALARGTHHHALEPIAHYTCLDCGHEWDADADADADAEELAEAIPVCCYCGELADLWISLLPDSVPAVPLCLSCALAASRMIADAVGDTLDALGIPDGDELERISATSSPAAARSPVPVPGGNRATRRAAIRRRRQHMQPHHVGKGKRA